MIPIEYSLNVELIKERLLEGVIYFFEGMVYGYVVIFVLLVIPIILIEFILPYLKECEWGLPPDWDHSS